MSRRLLGASLVVTLMLALSGCVAIPTSSGVTVGRSLDGVGGEDIEFRPDAPVAGASQEQILRGFVAAFTGSAKDYDVARQFLSTRFSSEWNPYQNVVVRTGAEGFAAVGDTTMEYSVSAGATVDETGAYRQNNSPVPLTLQFGFVEEKGEWRISAADDGIVLSNEQFSSIFDQHTLYYLDPAGENLVPDLRWFPGGTATLRVVSALLDGPPAWLQGTVRTAFPEGTKLATPSVEVQSGIAIVDLSPDALAANTSERQLMQLQLATSLANVSSIRRVSISVSGAPLSIPDLGSSAPLANPQVDIRPVVFKDGEFGYLEHGDVIGIPGFSGKVAGVGPSGATVAVDAGSAAVSGVDGVSLVQSGETTTTLLDRRADLVTPSLDSYGYVWSASRSNPGSIRAFNPDGVPFEVPTAFAAGSEIVSIDVSRDGARIAILLDTPTGPRLVVTAINRDSNAAQSPIGLSVPVLDASDATGTALDATWVNNLSIAMLSSVTGTNSAMLYVVGGERSSLGQVDAISLVGGNGEDGLRALSTSSTVLARSGNGWTDTRVAASFLATQR